MLLKKLELYGFKSFADKTEFDFRPGVTTFVGPNGCGKSNIVDAMRWILGEQRARAVRGTQMADVIFNGTSSRRSLGYAEASLTFLNDKGILPTDYTEVCVTRRLYRSGESEYLLNRQPCRLRDIRQLFMDTGVGVDTYSIIEQGKVDRFIQSNAKERRVIFEEAAGISRYKAQRKEAQSRLERTHINLQKVEVQLEEQRKQLRSIKYQAAKARRFRQHTERLRELVVSLSIRNYKAWEAKRKAVELEIAALEGRDGSLSAELAQIDSLMKRAEAEIASIEQVRLEKRDALHHAESRMEAAETSIEHSAQRIREFQEETELGTRTIWSLSEKLRQTHEEIAAAERDLEAILRAIQDQATAIAAEVEKADATGSECERLAAAIEEWKNRTVQVIERATTLRNELSHMDSGRRQQLARRSRLMAQLDEKAAEVARIDEEVRRLTGRRDEISERLADRASLLREHEHSLSLIEEDAQWLESDLREVQHREAQCLSRRDILQDIEMRAEDVESGVKRLLRTNDGQVAGFGIQGMIADLIRADLPYARAIEAAFGDSAQYVVTIGEDGAGAAASLLRTDRSGRAGLIPLARARGPELADLHLDAEPGVIGRASDLVQYEARLEPVVRHLLGHTWIVANLTTALHLSKNGGVEMRFVTLEGERVDPSGAIIGGEPLPGAGIVSRKSELAAIQDELGQLSTQIAAVEAERGRAIQRLDSLRAETASLRKEIEHGNIEKLTNENEILNLRRRQKILTEESTVIRSETAEIEETVRGYDEREQALKEQLAEATREHDHLQGEVESARRNLADQQAAVGRLREEVTHLKVELAAKEARRGGLEQSIQAARESISEREEEIASARRRLEELRGKQAEAERKIEEARALLQDLAEEREALQAEIARLGEEGARAQERRTEQAERTRALRAEQEELRQKLHNSRLGEQEHRVRMEGLVERVFSEQGVRLEDVAAESQEAEEERDWDAVQEEIGQLREKIRRMGGVNEESIDEETSLEIAIAGTEGQRDDLTNAEGHLREVIRKLNRVSRDKFAKTFEEIRKNFQETFRRVFGGGRADLMLEEEEPDVLEAGIEVLACPPGKELRSITLLSGGEKTMTTIALLFAIFRTKPSPFCVLDEVDAALDESNIERFASMLMDFIKDSQFIIITHSKRTIGISNVLYGITMQEKGVSKKVAVTLESGSPANN